MILLKRTPGAAAFVLFEVRLDQSLATQLLGWTEGRGGGTSAGELPSKSTSVKQESTWGSFCKHIQMQQAKKNTRNWKLINQKMTVRVYLMKSSVNVMHFHLLFGEDFKNYSVSKKNSSPLLLGFLTFFSIFFSILWEKGRKKLSDILERVLDQEPRIGLLVSERLQPCDAKLSNPVACFFIWKIRIKFSVF